MGADAFLGTWVPTVVGYCRAEYLLNSVHVVHEMAGKRGGRRDGEMASPTRINIGHGSHHNIRNFMVIELDKF